MANILVVDDLESIRKFLMDALSLNGHNISEATSGEEAIAFMQEDIFDIAIVDFKMGNLDGLDLLKAIKNISPHTEIIMITGYPTIDMAVEAMQLGVYDFITKPINVEELTLLIGRALEKMELADSVRALRTQIKERYTFPDIVGKTPVMQSIFALMEEVCQFDSAVLITGESGTGKELVAQAIYSNSHRYNKPFIPVNCAAFPESIQESELFGHMKGAFTDAYSNKKGLFEEAHGGTVFLDEIAEATLATQAKLLRFLENGEIRRVGENTPIYVDVRLIAATNKDLIQEVDDSNFRGDLYYRINVIRIHLPPLRDRKDDIPLLAYHFIRKHARNKREHVQNMSRETLSLLMGYDWPGNIRELENIIQYSIALTTDKTILPSALPENIQSYSGDSSSQSTGKHMTLDELEKAYILQILEEANWNREKAAEILGIGRATIYRKLQRYGFAKSSPAS